MLNSPVNFNDPTGHVCSDPDDESGFCEGSANVKTKIGNNMVAGNGIQRGNGKPPVTSCLICHVNPPTATPTLTPTPTTNNCLGAPHAACVPTATITPSPTPTVWQPFGQRAGQNIANTAVAFAPTAIDFCLGAPNGYAGPGCGQWVGQAYPPAAFGGEVFDFSVVAVHFLLANTDLNTPNYPTANPLSATPSATQTQFPQTPTSSSTPWLMTPTIVVPNSTPTPLWSQ